MPRRGIKKVGKGRYRVDFGLLQKKGLGRILPFHKTEITEVDPYAVGQAVRGVMEDCKARTAGDDRILLWNSYRVFFEESDRQGLRPLERRLKAELDTVVRSTVQDLKAETAGEVIVDILVPEEDPPPQGFGDVLAEYVDTSKFVSESGGEPTVRVSPFGRSNNSPEETERVAEPAADGALQLQWSHGSQYIPLSQKFRVGRASGGDTFNFIELIGANNKISKYQLAIENGRDSIVITRPQNANPVQVGNRLVQAGGKMQLDKLPVQISLSSGEMILKLDRVHM